MSLVIDYPSTNDACEETIELLMRARELAPKLRERAAACADLGHLPAATIDDLQRAGFFRIMQPAAFGGYELDPQVFFAVQGILAEGCMSTAWVLGVVGIHNWQLGMFDIQAQRDVWHQDSSTLISSSYMPVGQVKRVGGGFSLSGRWSFSSGSKHCQWAFLGAMVPAAQGDAAPEYRTFLVPIADYEIVENWDVSGLNGTGSHDIVVAGAYVPEYRTHRALDGFNGTSPGCAVNTNPIFRLPFGQIFSRAVSSSSIGALQGALDAFVEVNTGRTGRSDGKSASLDPATQYAAAAARSVIDECQLVLNRNLDRMVAAVRGGAPLTMDERIKMRFDAALVSDKCVEAVNQLFHNCGAQAIFRNHPLNRCWLDINAGRAHIANNAAKFGRNLGATMMGSCNQDFFL